jgi:hypothetical protein
MISSQHNSSLRQLERLMQEKDEELTRLDNLKKNEFRDMRRLSEIDMTIQEIRRKMMFHHE